MGAAVFLKVIFLYLGIICSVISAGDIQQLNADDFDAFIAANELSVIVFKASEECPSCNKAMEYLARVPPQPDLVTKEIQKRYVIDDDLAEKYSAVDYPGVVLFRRKQPLLFTVSGWEELCVGTGVRKPGKERLQSSDDLIMFIDWLEAAANHEVPHLHDSTFEHLTQAATGATTGDWFVLFFTAGTKVSDKVFPPFDSAALHFKHRMNFAKVDAEINVNLVKRFNVTKTPHIILFKQGKMYRYEPEKYDMQSFSAFIEGWYRNVKMEFVPKEPTAFDNLTESIALFIKERMDDPERRWMVQAVGVLLVVGLSAVFYLIFCFKGRDSRHKSD